MKQFFQCSKNVYVFILAIYFSFIINFPFILHGYQFLNPINGDSNILITLTIPIFLFFIFYSLFSLLCIRPIEKLIFIPLTLLSSLLSYSYLYYGFVFDDYSLILDTIKQTQWSELKSFLTPSLFAYFLLTGIIPSFFIFKTIVIYSTQTKEWLYTVARLCAYPICYIALFLPLLNYYHPMMRLSGLAGRPPFQIVPTNFFENFFHYSSKKIIAQIPYQKIGTDAIIETKPKNGKNNLLILVVGETARADHFELNGYPRKTNDYTKKQDIISFNKALSCGTSTRISVRCLFSSLDRKEFSLDFADNQDNLLDLLKYAGVSLFWLDNNGGGDCQGVCKHIDSQIVDGSDGDMIKLVEHKMRTFSNRNHVIILHLKGSHGPDYFTKYPPNFNEFLPDCRKREFRMCQQKTLLNAYDNSILYTDFVLSNLIEVLKKQESKWNTALIYTSDHGESIGEHGIYGHCAPYLIAPPEQTHVPFLIWASQSFASEKNLSYACLQQRAKTTEISHDYFFHSIVGIMDIKTEAYQDRLDLFKPCRQLKT